MVQAVRDWWLIALGVVVAALALVVICARDAAEAACDVKNLEIARGRMSVSGTGPG